MNQTIKLDTRKRDGTYGEARIAPLRRGERNNALLTVKVCANGQPYDLEGKTASLVATTAAGKLVGPCPMEVADEGIARIMLPAALYSAVGSFRGYVEIREGETLVDTTDRFGGKVIECADLDSEQAAEFTPLLGELQNAVADEAKRVEAEGERSSAETKRDEAEKKRGKAEEQRAKDSKTRLEELAQAKINAETATGEANTARDEAKKAATDATSAAGRATDAAGLAETAKTNANTAAEEAKSAATKAETAASSANSAAESASSAAVTAGSAASTAGRAADEADSAATKANASANKADIAAGKANEATVAATNAATKANEVEAKLTGNVLKGKAKDTFVHVDDAFPSSLLGIEIEGACRQDGTPSPDNPVPIEVVENPVLKVFGRNLANPSEAYYRATGGRKPEKIPDGFIFDVTSDANRIIEIPVELKKGQKFAIDFDEKQLSGTTQKIQIYFDKYQMYMGKKTQYVAPGDVKYIGIYIKEGTVGKYEITNFRVTRNVDDGYKPYTSQSIAFTLPAEHPYLAKAGNNTDEIVIDEDGNVELVARVGVDKNVRVVSTFVQGQYYKLETRLRPFPSQHEKYSGTVFCSTLPWKYASSNREGIYRTWTGIYVSDTSGRTKEEIQAEVDRNAPLTVVASIPETRYQLGKIEMPKAQDSIVNVWTDAEVTPNTGIEYTRDVNIVVANLESAIASITQG